MSFQIKLLDGLQIDEDGVPSPLLNSPKGLALLFYLLITQKPVKREVLADLLWDSDSTDQALRNLRALLFRVRKAIPQIQTSGDRVSFAARQEDKIDLFTLTQSLDTADPQQFGAVLSLYQHDLLRDFYLPDSARYNEWLTIEREHLRQRVLHSCEKLSKLYQEQGDWRAGLATAQRWLALDSYSEDAYYYHIVFLAAIGQARLAQGQYQKYCHLIAGQFDLEPTPRMVALFEQINASLAMKDQLSQKTANSQIQHQILAPDWGEAPALGNFFGRSFELAQLEDWLLVECCPVVTILGIGGQGKTTLAARAARAWADQFDGVIWRSLLNAPLPAEILSDLLVYLSGGQISDLPASIDAQLTALGKYLKTGRFLVILDNLESVLLDEAAGKYCAEYTDYERILQIFSSNLHQSSLLITSRENPTELERLARDASQLHSLQLTGLQVDQGTELLHHAGVSGSAVEMTQLIERYSGNPLAIKLVVQVVRDFYAGSISAFLLDEPVIFEDIRTVLDQQFRRLSGLEREILLWLAIEREPIPLTQMQARLLYPPRQRNLLEAVYHLQRRCLVEKHAHGISLQNVIIEYLTDHLIEQITREVMEKSSLYYLAHFALQPAEGREYVRLSQKRRIIQPVLQMLSAESAPDKAAKHIRHFLDHLRGLSRQEQGYAGGNLLNILLNSGLDPAQFDFSGVNIWQLNLQGVDLQKVNFAGADFSGSIFTDRFGLIYAVAYSPDGKRLAAGSGDGWIHLWSVTNNRPIFTVHAHIGSVWGIAFSPDGEILASCGSDNSIRLWDVYSGAAGKVLLRHNDGVLALAFSPDGRTLASAGGDGYVHLWNVATGEVLHTLAAHRANVQAVVFSPDGTWLATGGRDREIFLWQIKQLSTSVVERPHQVLHGHAGWVTALAFHPDGSLLASTGDDAVIRLWNLPTGDQAQIIQGHTAGVQALAFSPDGATLASGGHDHSVRLWDWRTGQIQYTFWGHTNWVYSLAFSPDSRTLASGSWDHSVRLWDVRGQYALHTNYGAMRWIFGLAFSPDGRTLASTNADKKVRLWDVASGEILQTLLGHQGWVWNAAFTPDGDLIASISMDHTIRLWEVHSGALLAVLKGHQDGLQALAISPDGRILATGGLDHSILLWDIQDIRQTRQASVLKRITGHSGWCLGLAFSADGAILASSSADHTVRLWDVNSGSCLQVLAGHSDGVQQVLFHPNNRMLVSAGWDKVALLWDVEHGSIIRRFEGHSGILSALALSPDGHTLATAGNDQSIFMWKLESGLLHQKLRAHDNWIFYLKFSPDGCLLASASSDETIKLWDVASGEVHQCWHPPGPYAGMNLSGARGLSDAQMSNMKALGAIG